MTAKKSGWLFFIITMTYVLTSMVIGYLAEQISIEDTLWLSEAIIILPSLVFACAVKEPLRETTALHKIRIPTICLSVLYTALLGPLVMVCNAATMLFVENTAEEILLTISEISYGKMFFYVGILAPVCEECVFRGVLYTGFRKTGTPLQAILWTAVLFGLFHMNLNQMAYAVVLGIAFGLLREATGSIWAGIVGHISLNSYNVLIYYIQDHFVTEELAGVEEAMTQEMLMSVIGIFMIIAVFTTAIALCVLALIAKIEHGQEYLRAVWTNRRKARVWSIPLWTGILICTGLIAMDLVIMLG